MPKTGNDAQRSESDKPTATRILVINDTPEILEAFRDILEDEGYETLLYSYPITKAHEIERLKPDLIILDYIFGRSKAGWQTLQLLKMRRSTAGIPVIVCTAATREVREIEGYLTAHDIQVVPKPFDIDDLLSAVKRALNDVTHSAKLVLDRENAQREPDGDE
ncbi:MAG TPA: response regulator [Ktedonobacterales bacterium]